MHARLLGWITAGALCLSAGDWSKPTEILVDETVCASYRARFDGVSHLVIRVALAPGWHTFAMDNQVRADEKLAGKKPIGMDKPTSFTIGGGLAESGDWMQKTPVDFSKPELRIFTWGYENEAVFAVPVKRAAGASEAQITIKAQACTESICKNIDVTLQVDLAGEAKPEPLLSGLEPVRRR